MVINMELNVKVDSRKVKKVIHLLLLEAYQVMVMII